MPDTVPLPPEAGCHPPDFTHAAAASPAALLGLVSGLRDCVSAEAAAVLAGWGGRVERRPFRLSAANFADYLALRRHDLRPLQTALMPWGLSSLGRCEARVRANLDAVAAALAAIAGAPRPGAFPGARRYFRGERLLARNAVELFGPRPDGPRQVRILVTLPPEAATDPALMRRLVEAGTDAMRINCAHDGPDAWGSMIANLRAAEAAAGRRVRVLMDLAGPKVRTGSILSPAGDRRIGVGDPLLLTAAARFPRRDAPLHQATCTIPDVLACARPGHRVFIDDGRVGAVVAAAGPDGLLLRVEQAPPDGHRLKPEKGLNFPDTELGLAALTDDDRADLDFVAAHADLIGYSFVQSAEDVHALQEELRRRRPDDWRRLGLVAKIETPRAVRNLPGIIVAAAGRQPFGIMIARGDLAVELGFERTAEMQEEILWLAEAAHVPVIWATQVLETLVKKGLPTRGEMTDAAMASRAECVMLNKGEHVAEAVAALDRLLGRMAGHQMKKTPRLRALLSW